MEPAPMWQTNGDTSPVHHRDSPLIGPGATNHVNDVPVSNTSHVIVRATAMPSSQRDSVDLAMPSHSEESAQVFLDIGHQAPVSLPLPSLGSDPSFLPSLPNSQLHSVICTNDGSYGVDVSSSSQIDFLSLTPLQTIQPASSMYSILEAPHPLALSANDGSGAVPFDAGAYAQQSGNIQMNRGAPFSASQMALPRTFTDGQLFGTSGINGVQQYSYFPPTPPSSSPGGNSTIQLPPLTGPQNNAYRIHEPIHPVWYDQSLTGSIVPSSTAFDNASAILPGFVQGPNAPLAPIGETFQSIVEYPIGSRECARCGTTETSYWRKDEMGHFLCNNCGTSFRTLDGTEHLMENGLPNMSRTNHKRSTPNRRQDLQCANCNTKTTTLWRRDANSNPVCNACGLYYKLHQVHRPISMRKEIIQSRKRTHKGGKSKSNRANQNHSGNTTSRPQATNETRTITTNPYVISHHPHIANYGTPAQPQLQQQHLQHQLANPVASQHDSGYLPHMASHFVPSNTACIMNTSNFTVLNPLTIQADSWPNVYAVGHVGPSASILSPPETSPGTLTGSAVIDPHQLGQLISTTPANGLLIPSSNGGDVVIAQDAVQFHNMPLLPSGEIQQPTAPISFLDPPQPTAKADLDPVVPSVTMPLEASLPEVVTTNAAPASEAVHLAFSLSAASNNDSPSPEQPTSGVEADVSSPAVLQTQLSAKSDVSVNAS